jgi:hypothetical protein
MPRKSIGAGGMLSAGSDGNVRTAHESSSRTVDAVKSATILPLVRFVVPFARLAMALAGLVMALARSIRLLVAVRPFYSAPSSDPATAEARCDAQL